MGKKYQWDEHGKLVKNGREVTEILNRAGVEPERMSNGNCVQKMDKHGTGYLIYNENDEYSNGDGRAHYITGILRTFGYLVLIMAVLFVSFYFLT